MANWVDAGEVSTLKARGRRIFKPGGRQILLLQAGDRIVACNNRCPHEGYPLSEGTLADGCTLTCNWHNWKFDLVSGETLVGGDRLTRYPVEVRDGHVYVDVADVPAAERQTKALSNLAEAIEDNSYDRMAREVARFLKAGGDPHEPLRRAILSRATRLEYGMTHAFAAAVDWLDLHAQAGDEARRLAALIEPLAHISWDTLREPEWPFTDAIARWDEMAFVEAIELEDEVAAVSAINAALIQENVEMPSLKRAFARAALAHYQDFGHAAIYTVKAFALIERLGRAVARPVLASLARSIVYASREDRIPEFRHYDVALKAFGVRTGDPCRVGDLVGQPVTATLDRISGLREEPLRAYRLLLEASAVAMLRFDTRVGQHVDKPVSHNASWLDFTHMLTFGNAVRDLCALVPELWPQALLQMGCFLGRNSSFLLPEPDRSTAVADRIRFLDEERAALYDHGLRDPIFACHRVKVLAAVAEETAWAGPGTLCDAVLAATNRYLHGTIKGHHALRLATQSLAFVDAEG